MGYGPWPAVLLIIAANTFSALALGGTVPPLEIAGIITLCVGLVAFIVAWNSTGTDIFGVQAGVIAGIKAASLAAFITGLILIAVAAPPGMPPIVSSGLNLTLGGFAFFGGLNTAKPGGS